MPRTTEVGGDDLAGLWVVKTTAPCPGCGHRHGGGVGVGVTEEGEIVVQALGELMNEIAELILVKAVEPEAGLVCRIAFGLTPTDVDALVGDLQEARNLAGQVAAKETRR